MSRQFLTPPTVPVPTADSHAATKKYVDDNAGHAPHGSRVLIAEEHSSNWVDLSIPSELQGKFDSYDLIVTDYYDGYPDYLIMRLNGEGTGSNNMRSGYDEFYSGAVQDSEWADGVGFGYLAVTGSFAATMMHAHIVEAPLFNRLLWTSNFLRNRTGSIAKGMASGRWGGDGPLTNIRIGKQTSAAGSVGSWDSTVTYRLYGYWGENT